MATCCRSVRPNRRRPASAGRPRHAWLGRLVLLLLVPLWSCQAQPTVQPGADAEQALRQRIDAEVGAAACSRDDQCRVLALGAKACGGPAGWIAWSTTTTRIDRLQPLADALAERQRQRAAKEGIVSDCRVVTEPAVACTAAACRLIDTDRWR